METREYDLCLALVNGPQRPKNIMLAPATKHRIRRRLEARGLLKRTPGGWRFTTKGYKYAYKEYGLTTMMASRNYFEMDLRANAAPQEADFA